MKYSVVIPVYNEEEVLALSFSRLYEVFKSFSDFEFIFVDDGSYDNSLLILKKIASEHDFVKIISFSRNFGHQEAVSAGLEVACGEACIIIDADLQDPPEVIPKMIELWQKGADIVYGKRTKREGEGFLKKFFAWGFYRFLSLMGAQNVPKDTGDFRLLDKKVVALLNSLPEKNRFLRGMSAWAGFNQVPYEYVRNPRAAGTTKYTTKKMLKLAGDGITSFSNKPLKLPLVLGFILTPLSCAYFIVALILSCVGIVNYYHILFALCFVLLCVILISLGIIGVYLGRIYDEAKTRPLFIIREKINID